MLISAIISEARTQVNDPSEPPSGRWSAAQFEAALAAFFAQVGASNAEALLNEAGKLNAIPEGLTSTDVFPWDAIYRKPAVDFLCWKYHQADAQNTRDQELAAVYKKRFEEFFDPAGS